ncbi:GNAT family N-acetyltransferase [Fulvivirga sp. M361]|uniref:GNAT family N-acetyltransferase n=1 Tax=Fulvivirga sp. M361 TaxID=2594266 RepID=UPI001179B17E|nr:GNAT family N-acetyltransferase [Fulvivirga sp. M361]TRX60595.1 GNAT family N-acetyltransferase [Fulvivirga sp. M361]
MQFIQTEDTTTISELRAALYQRFSAPVDAMWEMLYIASSQPYLIENGTQKIGYCSIDDNESLLQIFLNDGSNHLMDRVVKSLIDSKLISGAKLSSIESVSFNACLTYSRSVQTNTFCFQYYNRPLQNGPLLNIELVSQEDIQAIKSFLKDQIGFDDTFGYTENLVQRREFYVVKGSGDIIATSECRLSDSQPEIADLGVIVNRDYQGKGIATQVLKQQANRAQEIKRRPICSTTYDNVASKKAIEKAGFYCSHIIFDINFADNKTQKNDIPGFGI